MKNKIGIIVPYRNRHSQLQTFYKEIVEYLEDKDLHYEIIIVEQDDAKQFNRGMLLNVGYVYAKKLKCSHIVFHDVDMIPVDVDYSVSEVPLHLATNFVVDEGEKDRENFDEYFGGVTMFPIETFEKINGYSNKYWGWGYEDDDLLLRCATTDVELDEIREKNYVKKSQVLQFNGVNAYIKGKNFNNVVNLNSDFTIFVSFYPEVLRLDHTKESDNFTIFSLGSGYNTELSYNSFRRYSFSTFDKELNNINLYSEIKPNYMTSICLTFDKTSKKVTMYQDGVVIKELTVDTKFYSHILEQIFYVGCSKTDDEQFQSYFKGYFHRLAFYGKKLNPEEILEISKDGVTSLTQNRKKYKSATKLKLYYDSNYIKNYSLVDLSGNENDGKIVNCEIVKINLEEHKVVKIPHRRKSVFKSLKHEENGFLGNKWKDQATRWNQLRFHNEVNVNLDLTKDDGLSDLQFVLHTRRQTRSATRVKVGI